MKLIELTQGYFAKVDNEDYERINVHKWYAVGRDRRFYAQRTVRVMGNYKLGILMHREILQVKNGAAIDHINRDSLDNQKSNLRLASARVNRINSINSEKALHIYKDKRHKNGSWIFVARINGVNRYKYFKTKAEAETEAEQYRDKKRVENAVR